MQIERAKGEILIRLSTKLKNESLQHLVDYLSYYEATASSKATQVQVDALAKEVKKGWWAENKSRLLNQ